MQTDEVIKIAKQTLSKYIDGLWLAGTPDLEAFAKLVAAKERERIIEMLESLGTDTNEDGGEDEPTRAYCVAVIRGEAWTQ